MYRFINGFNLPKLLYYNVWGNLCRPAFGVKKLLQLDAFGGVISTQRTCPDFFGSEEKSVSLHLIVFLP